MFKKKTILIILVLLIIAVWGIYENFIKEEKLSFSFEKVVFGAVLQEVSETGQVEKGKEIKLGFKNSGEIKKIHIQVGDKVQKGMILAELETVTFRIQLNEAKAAEKVAQAKLDKLLAGASEEEIKIAETAVSNAERTLENARQSLEDTKNTSQGNLENACEDALNILDSSYLEGEKSLNLVDDIFRTYFTEQNQSWVVVKESKNIIGNALDKMKLSFALAKNDSQKENIDNALAEALESFKEIRDALTDIRETIEGPNYRNTVSSADKSSLDTQRTSINTALTNITNSQQSIFSLELTNAANINTAESNVVAAEGQLLAAQAGLAKILAGPRKMDIDLCQAQVDQAQAQVNILENKIQESKLYSPINGQIIELNKRTGELVQPIDTVVALLPSVPFKIETDIYEEDVVKVNIGNPVDISLVAFPDEIFKGKIISIDPAGKLIDGVVYYKIVVAFDTPTSSVSTLGEAELVEEISEGTHPVKSSKAGIPPQAELFNRVKPGMTADLLIKTAQKENVLIIAEEAVQKRDDKIFVEVFKDGKIEEREIKTGLLGSDDMLEIISGLKAGEKVILPQ